MTLHMSHGVRHPPRGGWMSGNSSRTSRRQRLCRCQALYSAALLLRMRPNLILSSPSASARSPCSAGLLTGERRSTCHANASATVTGPACHAGIKAVGIKSGQNNSASGQSHLSCIGTAGMHVAYTALAQGLEPRAHCTYVLAKQVQWSLPKVIRKQITRERLWEVCWRLFWFDERKGHVQRISQSLGSSLYSIRSVL